MRILIICQYFPPEVAPIGVMMKELAADLAAAGHRVTVVTGFPNHPRGIVFAGYRRRLFQREMADGIRVIRCYMHVSPRRSVLARILGYLSFGLSALSAALLLPRHDAVLLPSPPLTNGALALALRLIRGWPYVYNVQDIFPDAAITAGIITNPAVIGALRRFERCIYRRAGRIAVISEGFRANLIAKGVPAGKIELIHNWLDAAEIAPQPRDNEFSGRHGLNGRFVVLYSGTIGLISGAEILVDCARRLSGCRDILFLFVGEGVTKETIVRMAEQQHLSNMRFLPFQERELLPQVQSSADVSVVTLKRGMGRTSVPSKILGYMAAARPIIASVDPDCDTSRFIARAECGLCVEPENPDALTAAILDLYHHRRKARLMGTNGRRYIERFSSRPAATARYQRTFAVTAQIRGGADMSTAGRNGRRTA